MVQGKQNVVLVCGEFKLSEFELTELKLLKKGVKSSGNGTYFEFAGEFVLSEYELPGFPGLLCLCSAACGCNFESSRIV